MKETIFYDFWPLKPTRSSCSPNLKTGFDFSLLYPRKNGLRKKLKVRPLDTEIK